MEQMELIEITKENIILPNDIELERMSIECNPDDNVCACSECFDEDFQMESDELFEESFDYVIHMQNLQLNENNQIQTNLKIVQKLGGQTN